MPPSKLATPAGIDHDYNFLHGIEHRIERSEKEIIEDRGLVERDELERARKGLSQHKPKENEAPGQAQIERALMSMGTVVQRAPKGIQRNRENDTTWARGSKCIHWQVEWMCGDGQQRVLSKAIGRNPLREIYLALVNEQRKLKMTDEERRVEKKRKAADLKQKMSKKLKTDEMETTDDATPMPVLQDPETGSWSCTSAPTIPEATDEEPPEPTISLSEHLYLLRTRTPSSFPKVLIPLDPSKSLDHLLRRRVLLEFPTIYVLETAPENLPEQFMLEQAFLAATGRKPLGVDMEGGRPLVEEVGGSGGEDSSSSSDSSEDEDEQMEDGEVV